MTEMLRKQEDEIKRVKMMKQLATMHAELEAAKRVEQENFGSVKEDQSLSTDSCSEDQLEKLFHKWTPFWTLNHPLLPYPY